MSRSDCRRRGAHRPRPGFGDWPVIADAALFAEQRVRAGAREPRAVGSRSSLTGLPWSGERRIVVLRPINLSSPECSGCCRSELATAHCGPPSSRFRSVVFKRSRSSRHSRAPDHSRCAVPPTDCWPGRPPSAGGGGVAAAITAGRSPELANSWGSPRRSACRDGSTRLSLRQIGAEIHADADSYDAAAVIVAKRLADERPELHVRAPVRLLLEAIAARELIGLAATAQTSDLDAVPIPLLGRRAVCRDRARGRAALAGHAPDRVSACFGAPPMPGWPPDRRSRAARRSPAHSQAGWASATITASRSRRASARRSLVGRRGRDRARDGWGAHRLGARIAGGRGVALAPLLRHRAAAALRGSRPRPAEGPRVAASSAAETSTTTCSHEPSRSPNAALQAAARPEAGTVQSRHCCGVPSAGAAKSCYFASHIDGSSS